MSVLLHTPWTIPLIVLNVWAVLVLINLGAGLVTIVVMLARSLVQK